MLSNKGARVDPCGNVNASSAKELCAEFIFFLLPSVYEVTTTETSCSNDMIHRNRFRYTVCEY